MKKQPLPTDLEPGPDHFETLFLPGLAVDTVVFGFSQKCLKVLLLQYRNTHLFALPGGFIGKEEAVDNAAKRVLRERTGLEDIFLEQFHTFGNLSRHDRASLEKIMAGRGIKPSPDHFLLNRFVSVGYYALVDYTKAVPSSDGLADTCAWYDFDKLPPLMLDHRQIVQKALTHLQEHLDRKLIGFNLMPETFTMNELQGLYETVLGTPLRRTSFQRKMLNLGILERVSKRPTGSTGKAPYLYRFAKA